MAGGAVGNLLQESEGRTGRRGTLLSLFSGFSLSLISGFLPRKAYVGFDDTVLILGPAFLPHALT